jgi:hypothetical protein
MTVDYGFGKVRDFRLWKGRERRLLQQRIDDDSFEQNDLEDILVYGVCEDKNLFLTQNELLYTVYSLYKESLQGELPTEWLCDCGEVNEDFIIIDDLIANNSDKIELSVFENERYRITFKAPEYNEATKTMFKNLERSVDRNFYNFMLSISSFEKIEDDNIINVDTNPSVMEDEIEAMPISDFDQLLEYYEVNSFMFLPTSTKECPHCGKSSEIFCDYLPSLLK